MSKRKVQLVSITLGGNGTTPGDWVSVPFGVKSLAVQSVFTRAAGGGTCDVFIQTTLDDGDTAIDIMQNAFTTSSASKVHVIGLAGDTGFIDYTPTDGSLTDDTAKDGLLGDKIRAKVVTAGTAYSGASSLVVTAVMN